MKTFRYVIKKDSVAILLCAVLLVMNFAVFKLYDIYFSPFLYSSLIAVVFLIIFIVSDWFKEVRRKNEREFIKNSIITDYSGLPEADTELEADYQEMIIKLGRELERLNDEYYEEKSDAEDYYTAWVHQIKNPIAVMKMKLSEDTPENRELSAELFRIEQYVDMALHYIRLGSEYTDLHIEEYSLDELIKESIRKYAPLFVGKKLTLDYTPADVTVVTDRKWFSCILDQFISNAVKYTSAGSVSIFVNEGELHIKDTGLGIEKQDLPRIFQKGYTGNNGRIGQKSSGLGLYLAKKAADLISVKIRAVSVPSEGSDFIIDFRK